jgi:hypothetical protein
VRKHSWLPSIAFIGSHCSQTLHSTFERELNTHCIDLLHHCNLQIIRYLRSSPMCFQSLPRSNACQSDQRQARAPATSEKPFLSIPSSSFLHHSIVSTSARTVSLIPSRSRVTPCLRVMCATSKLDPSRTRRFNQNR